MATRKLLYTLTLLLTLMLSPVQAQEGQHSPARDVRVVVDISGSMRVNDPDNLRRPAVRLIARLLPDGTEVGLWTFGKMVNMLVPHGVLNDDLRATLIADSEQINSIAQRTNIGGAIEKAADDWYALGRSLENTHLILLSDGKVDISPSQASNDQERERILEELAPALAEKGLTIHTIALSGEADLDLLGALADMTGGVARVADSADELSRIFADTMGQAVPANEVPLEDNRFTVDSGVEEFTALIFSATSPQQRELTLVSPEGQRYGATGGPESVRWAREAGYDLITVDRPPAGEWQLEGTLGEGSRVTVVSDLRLEVKPMPARFQMGDEVNLQAFFTEEGSRITDPDFLGVITVTLSITTDDGRRGSRILSAEQPPADGLYGDTIASLPEPGQYLLELEADGNTFSRKFRKTLVLEAPEGQEVVPDGETIPLSDDAGTEPPDVGSAPEPPPEPEPEISEAGPVDLSQLEEPQPGPVPDPDPESAEAANEQAEVSEPSLLDRLLAWWPWLAGGLGVLVLALLARFLVKRRGRNDEDNESESAAAVAAEEISAEDDAELAELTAAMEAMEEVSGEPVDVQDPKVDEQPEPGDPSENRPETIQADAGARESEPADIPELTPEEEDVSGDMVDWSEVEEDKPKDADDLAEEGSEEPTATESDAIPADTGEDPPGDDDEEFGLEDFDLSDIDDLPDLDVDDDVGERDKPSGDEEGKKE